MALSHRKAVLLLLIAMFSWSITGVIVKEVSFTPEALLCIGSFIGAVTQGVYLKKQAFLVTRSTFYAAFCYLSVVIGSIFALRYTTAANAIALQFTSPIFAIVYSALFQGKKPKRRDIFTALFVLLGTGLFFIEHISFQHNIGNIIALGTAVSIALYSILLECDKNDSQVVTTFWGNVLIFFSMLLFCNNTLFQASFLDISKAILLGTFGFGIAWICYCTAIKKVSAVEGLIITTPEAVLSPLIVFLILGERPDRWSCIGSLIVLCSVTWYSYMNVRDEALPICKGSLHQKC